MFGALHLQGQSPFGVVTTAARVLSFASFETNRFLGMSTAERVLAFWRQPWVAPFALIVAAAGIAQPWWMLATAFRRARTGGDDWTRVRTLTAVTVLLVSVSYFFSVRGPQAHAFYVVFPVAALFAGSCWQVCAQAAGARMRRWERVAGPEGPGQRRGRRGWRARPPVDEGAPRARDRRGRREQAGHAAIARGR